jgi:hypothetical protein
MSLFDKVRLFNVYKIKSRNFGIASGGGHCPRMPHRPTLLWFSFVVVCALNTKEGKAPQ